MVASILKIVITQNTICDNLVGFPKSGHICIWAASTHMGCPYSYGTAHTHMGRIPECMGQNMETGFSQMQSHK